MFLKYLIYKLFGIYFTYTRKNILMVNPVVNYEKY